METTDSDDEDDEKPETRVVTANLSRQLVRRKKGHTQLRSAPDDEPDATDSAAVTGAALLLTSGAQGDLSSSSSTSCRALTIVHDSIVVYNVTDPHTDDRGENDIIL